MASNKSSAVGVSRVFTVDNINGLVAAATNILTVPVGTKFVCQGAIVRLTAVTGVATVGVARIRDITAGADLVGNTTLTAVVAAGDSIPLPLPVSVNKVVAAGSIIALDITTAYTVATVATLSVDLLGYFV